MNNADQTNYKIVTVFVLLNTNLILVTMILIKTNSYFAHWPCLAPLYCVYVKIQIKEIILILPVKLVCESILMHYTMITTKY